MKKSGVVSDGRLKKEGAGLVPWMTEIRFQIFYGTSSQVLTVRPDICTHSKSPGWQVQASSLTSPHTPLPPSHPTVTARSASCRCQWPVPCPWHATLTKDKTEVRKRSHTLSINEAAKPPSYFLCAGGPAWPSGASTASLTGLLTSLAQHFPVELLITLARTLGSRPSLCPRSIASATTTCWTPKTMLLQILAARPEPDGPQ